MAPYDNIAAAVVLYNPTAEAVDNILRYRDSVRVVYAVDNSEKCSQELENRLSTIGNIEYIPSGGNAGVGRALNIAVERALKAGYDYLLTMDQDSKASPGMVSALLACLEQYDRRKVGIVAPFHCMVNSVLPEPGNCGKVLTVMTSGNLVNLHVAKTVGPFMEELFIDYVDHEYCLRLQQNGYLVIESSSAVLEHSVGDTSTHRLLTRTVGTTNHPPFRRYYMTRNRFHVMNKYRNNYPEYYRVQLRSFFVELLTLILFENQKWEKLKAIWRGYRHYRKGIFDKIAQMPV